MSKGWGLKTALGACCAFFIWATPGFSQTTGTTDSYWGQQTNTATTSQNTAQAGCDPAVQQQSDNNARYMVDNYTQMATSLYPTLPPSGFSGLSCLQQLMNSGLNLFWNPESLSTILAAIMSEVCAIASEMVVQAEQPLYQSAYATAPLGQIVPGVSLGGLFNQGFTVSPMMGNTSGGLLNITGPSNLMTGNMSTTSFGSGNLASYWGGNTQNNAQQPAYGSLFGTGGGITGMPNMATPAGSSSSGGFLGSLGSMF